VQLQCKLPDAFRKIRHQSVLSPGGASTPVLSATLTIQLYPKHLRALSPITVRKESEPPHVPRVLYPSPTKWRMNVDREHVKGAADKVKGAIKDTAGKVTGDKKLQTEGKIDKAKGAAHNVAGDVKDAVRHANDD
jgi:uncharacterized protein YjbJ (UPF0337 family)